MSLNVGTSVGPYVVVRFLGAGGMGEVYQARDARLGRDVALKVISDSFADDPDRLGRFQREAQVLAALSHPHIAAIHGIEEGASDSGHAIRALVLELVEGATLADRVANGSIPIDEVLSLARQIAEALEAAHERGIIHRDLKPANIKIKPDGTVKVLDFGLAKTVAPAQRGAGVSQSPTITTPAMTEAGLILGTAAYMAPEQAKGLEADKRSDVWAFGCVLYEMLTGSRPFKGDDVSDTLAAVLLRDPDWKLLPPRLPPPIHLLLRRCLERDRRRRMSDVAGALFAIDEAAGATVSPIPHASSRRLAYAGWVVAALVTAALLVAALLRRAPSDTPEMRLQLMTPPTTDPFSFALSPDGRSVVFQARVDGRVQLWLRPLELDEARPLTGTDGASLPFWSPDSRSVGFFSSGELKRFDLEGGFARTLASAPNPRRGAWHSDGTIVFGAASAGPLYRVPAAGGAVATATDLLPGQSNHRWPAFLPGSRRFLLLALGAKGLRGLYVGSLDDKQVRHVMDLDSEVAIMPAGHVLLGRQGALWAQRLNAQNPQVEGELIPVAPRLLMDRNVNGLAALSSSLVGSVAYRTSDGGRQIVWLDRSGRQTGVLLPLDDAQPSGVRLSSDGRTAAVHRMVSGNTDIWLIDTARGVPRRLTFDPAVEGEPIFSPDSNRVLFVSDRKLNLWDMYLRSADGTGEETLLLESGENKNPRDWSSDGRYVLFASQNPKTGLDIWALPLFGDRKPFAVAQTPFAEQDGVFSPDGRLVAFESNETGRLEIYVQPFPGPGAKVQISAAGGRAPRWPRKGSELFYVAPDNRLMSVTVEARGSTIDASTARSLFTLPEFESYVPSHDGQQFLVNTSVSETSPITVLLNWKPPVR